VDHIHEARRKVSLKPSVDCCSQRHLLRIVPNRSVECARDRTTLSRRINRVQCRLHGYRHLPSLGQGSSRDFERLTCSYKAAVSAQLCSIWAVSALSSFRECLWQPGFAIVQQQSEHSPASFYLPSMVARRAAPNSSCDSGQAVRSAMKRQSSQGSNRMSRWCVAASREIQ
jgi:hypothetical protein